jgi:hypothetical protein
VVVGGGLVVVGGGLVVVVVATAVGGVVACVEPPDVGPAAGAGVGARVVGVDVDVDVEGTVVEGEDVDGAVGIGIPGDSDGVVAVVLAAELAPGCSLATTMPMIAVAPVAANTAERVRRRRRRLARSRDIGVLSGFGCFIVDLGPFSLTWARVDALPLDRGTGLLRSSAESDSEQKLTSIVRSLRWIRERNAR